VFQDKVVSGTKLGGDPIILVVGLLLLGASLCTLKATRCFGLSRHSPEQTADYGLDEPHVMSQPLFYVDSGPWQNCPLHLQAIAGVFAFIGLTVGFSPLCVWAVSLWT
jgi:hypothetical protein